jgi:hypothetical protein
MISEFLSSTDGEPRVPSPCTLAASATLGMFGVPEAAELAQKIEDTMTRIMERAKRR